MKQLRACVKRRTGAAAVELALISPLLLTLLFGIMEFGWMFMARQMVHHAAADVTRSAILPGAESTVEGLLADGTFLKDQANSILANTLNLGSGDITLFRNPATSKDDPCEVLTVTVPTGAVMLPGYVLKLMDFDADGRTIEFTVSMAHPNYAGLEPGLACQ